jgi:hypothetical protein
MPGHAQYARKYAVISRGSRSEALLRAVYSMVACVTHVPGLYTLQKEGIKKRKAKKTIDFSRWSK